MAKKAYGGNIVGARVDWITATAAHPESMKTLWQFGMSALLEQMPEGETLSTWHGHGYRGWCDTGISVGTRPDSTLIRLSGSHAGDKWRYPAAACDNISRLDLAVDCEFETPEVAVSRDCYRQAIHKLSRNGRPPKRSLVISSDGGSTCYIGSRASEWYGRVYDKGVEQESHLPGHLWRWELEVKAEAAYRTAARVLSAPAESDAIASITLSWFSDRGARVPSFVAPIASTTGKREPRRVDRQAEWLARSVRPTALLVADSKGREAVRSILGLN